MVFELIYFDFSSLDDEDEDFNWDWNDVIGLIVFICFLKVIYLLVLRNRGEIVCLCVFFWM